MNEITIKYVKMCCSVPKQLWNLGKLAIGNMKKAPTPSATQSWYPMQYVVEHGEEPAPLFYDWRVEGAVTAVGEQQRCESCWAFTIAGLLEAFHYIQTGYLIQLSPQYLLDCSTYPEYMKKILDKCKRGNEMPTALKFVKENGMRFERDYPYKAKAGKCNNKTTSIHFNINELLVIEGDEEAMKDALYRHGPLMAEVNVFENSFDLYKEGVYYEENQSGRNYWHGVLIVGYGHDTLYGDYWIIKNSWSKDWGESGYMRIARNRNHCSISRYVLFVR